VDREKWSWYIDVSGTVLTRLPGPGCSARETPGGSRNGHLHDSGGRGGNGGNAMHSSPARQGARHGARVQGAESAQHGRKNNTISLLRAEHFATSHAMPNPPAIGLRHPAHSPAATHLVAKTITNTLANGLFGSNIKKSNQKYYFSRFIAA
jgi:hypothetical protein